MEGRGKAGRGAEKMSKTLQRVTLISCFYSAWTELMLNPHPSHSNPAFCHLFTAPLGTSRPTPHHHHSSTAQPPLLKHYNPHPHHRCARTTTRTQRPSTTRSTWSSTLPVSTCPYLSTLPAMMWRWRILPNIFFTNLTRENMLRNWSSCRVNKVAKSSFRMSRNQTWRLGE